MASGWRRVWLDVALAALLVVFTLGGTGPAGLHQGRTAPPAAYVLGVAAAAAVVFWRARPMWTFVAVGTVSVLYLGAGYPYGPIMVVLALAAFGLAARSALRVSLIATSALVGAALGALGIGVATGTRHAPELISVIAWFVLPAAFGMVLRTRREAGTAVRSEQARRAVSEERLRLAQEVHDVAGHGFSVIAMQAGVALRVLDRDRAGVRAALEAIRAASTEALDGLRAEVQALRDGDDRGRAPLRPHSGLSDLAALAKRLRTSGLSVAIEASVEPSSLPGELDRAAYRIVQESLTNVLRHAGPEAVAQVYIGRNGDELEVDIIDTGRGTVSLSGGTGIDGMRGRAEGLGGTLIAGPGPQGGFAVRARLPIGRAGAP